MFELEKSKKASLAISIALSIFSASGVHAVDGLNALSKDFEGACNSDISNEKVEFEIDNKGTLKSYNGYAKELTIPKGVKSIACGAFMNKTEIEKVNFPEGLEKIGEYAFYSCESLKEVILPNSLKKLGRLSFGNCKNCFKAHLGKNLENIGEVTFLGCTSLKCIDVDENNENFSSYNGLLFNKDHTILKMCPAGYDKDVLLPSLTKLISCYAFLSCKNIERVERISDERINIQDAAFYGCESLKEINVGENIHSIGSCAFTQCNSLKEFTINKSVKYLGSAAFMCCPSLKRVNCFSKNLKIGRNLFSSCPQTILIMAEEDSPLARYALKHSDHLALV